MLRFIRNHPFAGLMLALSLETWLALPGEAMIALAASTVVSGAYGAVRIALGGLAGMLVNDLVLFGLSQVGRDLLRRWLGLHALRLHLSPPLMLVAKFVPPLRSAAYVVYGLQGTPLGHFLLVSLLSSVLWVGLYTWLGRSFRHPLRGAMQWVERGGGWVTAAEWGLTLAMVLAVIL